MEDAMQVVRIDKKGRAVDHVVAAKKGEEEKVIWVALGKGGPWKVTFDKNQDGSPFDSDEYTIDQGDSKATERGPVKGKPGMTYKYNVRDASKPGMPITDDPDVDIE
jgi:hypothetical protein